MMNYSDFDQVKTIQGITNERVEKTKSLKWSRKMNNVNCLTMLIMLYAEIVGQLFLEGK